MDTPQQQPEVITEQSAEIGQLFKALALAQGEFSEIKKNRKVSVTMKSGGSYTFRYATLDSITAATRPALSKNGLSTSAWVKGEWLTVMLAHESGQWKSSRVKVGVPNGDWQAYGSALTYSRRHVMSAMLDVAADEDDDGNAACGNKITAREVDPMEALWNGLDDKGISGPAKQREWIERVLGREVTSSAEIKPGDLVILLETLEGKRPDPAAKHEPAPDSGKASEKAKPPLAVLVELLGKVGKTDKAEIRKWMGERLKREIKTTKDLTPQDLEQLTKDAEALAREAS